MSDKKEVAVVQDDPFLQMAERVAANPDIDADKLQKILDMKIQVMDRQARDEFYAAFNRVQANLPAVAKDAHNQQTSSNYSRLETISAAMKPVYTAEGFSTSFGTADSPIEGWTRVQGVLRHIAGHSETYFVDLPLDDVGIKGSRNKTALHGTGSTLTYGRRYLVCMMFDLVTGIDTDGNLPQDYISDEHAADLEALLTELSDKVQAEFWRKARVSRISDLLEHRYETYLKWLETKRAEA